MTKERNQTKTNKHTVANRTNSLSVINTCRKLKLLGLVLDLGGEVEANVPSLLNAVFYHEGHILGEI